MAFLEQLKRIYAFEENIVPKINQVLDLILTQTGLAEQEANEIRKVLNRLTYESLEHKSTIEKILGEENPYDK